MADNQVFISYKHEPTWVEMAAKFRLKLKNYAGHLKLDYFIDSEQILAGQTWRNSVDDALAGCTHMLVLLCDTYWDSPECRRELDAVLKRRAAKDPVLPCFVLAEPMNPAYLSFNADGSHVGDVRKVGDFQFLGPINDAQQLVSLQTLGKDQWGTAIEKMIGRLEQQLK